VRRAPALLVAAALVLVSLSGCSSNPNASCTGAATAGAASNLISVKGDFGQEPRVTFPTPLKTSDTQSTVNIQGTGEKLEKNQVAMINYTIYNATSGKQIGAGSYSKGGDAGIVVGKSITGLNQALLCSTVGSRLAVAIPYKDGFGSDASNFGLKKNDSVVMVVDVVRAFLARANGAVQPRQPGFPIVVLAPNGTPGISAPTGTAPKTLKIAVLKAGSGATVKKKDTVVVNYMGVVWNTTSTFESTWTGSGPTEVVAAADPSSQGGIPAGFASAIIGQKVGSQVIAIVPPSKGYGSAGNGGSVPGGATLVYVIDILGIQ
jgi:FKBP-type peptidyl-prolyl cis-trans isomerase